MLRVAYLGPAGTFTEDALREFLAGKGEFEPLPTATIPEAIEAVAEGRADRALAPFENSIEGSIRPTLDALALDVPGVTIIGEHDFRVRPQLIARREIALEEIEEVRSHPQPLSQCSRFLREQLPKARLRPAESTAQAVREIRESERPLAALGARSAAELYGCVILREATPDAEDNVTRFVWLAPAGTPVPESPGPWKTSIVFWELGADHPGALVEALLEFSSRGVNLSRIESRPLRQGLGRYMFFIDAEGGLHEEPVAAAIEGLKAKAERVSLLGSYPLR
jgi:prephenate dehydratase